jgi:hypothetical protein
MNYMRKLKSAMPLLLPLIFFGCSFGMPDWLEDFNHTISPDGEAAIYHSVEEFDGKFKISMYSHRNHRGISGGAGLFDFYYPESVNLKFRWINDSTVNVSYPSDAEILRKDSQDYYFGKIIYINYVPVLLED